MQQVGPLRQGLRSSAVRAVTLHLAACELFRVGPYLDSVACHEFKLPPPIGIRQVYSPSPKLDPARAEAFMLPVQSATLLLIGQGAVNLMAPKLSTAPATVPSLLETVPFRMIRNRRRLWDSVTPPGPGFLKKKL